MAVKLILTNKKNREKKDLEAMKVIHIFAEGIILSQ